MSKNKRATKAKSSPDSMRTRRRISRGFVSLEVSSRKHRRALRRQMASRTIDRQLHNPGQKVMLNNTSMYTAGGAFKYH